MHLNRSDKSFWFSKSCDVDFSYLRGSLVHAAQCHYHTFYIYNHIKLLNHDDMKRTGEYWLEVVAVQTKHSKVHTITTEGQYSPVS